MTSDSCPSADDLRKFVRCSVTEQQADSIGEHLETCPTCEATVVGLESDGDTVTDRIRQAAVEPTFSHETECQKILQTVLENGCQESPPSPDRELGRPTEKVLRDYQIVAKLGEGGMGTVYKAIHNRLKKTVALKVLPTARIGDQFAVARFEREMSVLGQLNHPNIVQALDAGEHDGQHYLVMELVDGSDLGEVVKRSFPLSIANACKLISEAALGLQFAHEHGFVHRDIKPSNLMLAKSSGRTGEAGAVVKILDLGLARALDQPSELESTAADLTTTGQVMGTLDYMAPEQGGDSHQVDIRADIYSLGATLYKLLTGDSPFAQHSQKPPLQRLMAIAQSEPPAIRTKRPDVPEKLASIVHRMLAKAPEDRFATPIEVVQALEPFCEHADLAQLLGLPSVPRTSPPESQVVPAPKVSDAGRDRSRAWHTILTGAAGFFALAAILLIVTRNGTVEVSSPDGKQLPDDVKVVVSRGGKEVELLQSDNQWSAKIVNGEYRVHVRGGNDAFVIKDATLIVNRMGRAVVKVELKPAAESPAKASPVATSPVAISPAVSAPQSANSQDPDRRAAEWVLSVGGSVTVKLKYDELPVAKVEDLPKKDFELLDIRMIYIPEYDDAGMVALEGCKNLRAFEVLHHVSDVGAAHLRDCENLKILRLQATHISDEGMAVFKNCKKLELLELDGTPVGGDGLAHFENCVELKHLGLGFTHVGDDDLRYFKDCTKLEALQLRHTKVTDRGLEHLKNCKSLMQINFENMNITDAGLAHLSGCKMIEGLSLVLTQVSDAGLAQLAGCPKLNSLNLRATKVTEAGVKKLAAALPKCRIDWDGGVIDPTRTGKSDGMGDE